MKRDVGAQRVSGSQVLAGRHKFRWLERFRHVRVSNSPSIDDAEKSAPRSLFLPSKGILNMRQRKLPCIEDGCCSVDARTLAASRSGGPAFLEPGLSAPHSLEKHITLLHLTWKVELFCLPQKCSDIQRFEIVAVCIIDITIGSVLYL